MRELMVQDATLHNLEIVGEATKSLSPTFRASHPEVPWADMAGMRDILIHRYVSADNAAAIRVYEKVGFRTVGIMREYWRSPDGTWRDGLLMDSARARVRSSVRAREWSPLELRGRNRAIQALRGPRLPVRAAQERPRLVRRHTLGLRAALDLTLPAHDGPLTRAIPSTARSPNSGSTALF
jgi:hypothetical protein